MGRFTGLTARQRYEKEYRECRVFNTYTRPQDWEFMAELGDLARFNAFTSWALIKDEREAKMANEDTFEYGY
jgi:hypothetical protein